MKKITKVISGVVLAAGMICLASCSMITGLFSDTVYEESGKEMEFVPNSFHEDGSLKFNREYLNDKVKFNIEKGGKYLVTLEATSDENVDWIGVYGYAKEKKGDAVKMFDWAPFCKTEGSAKAYKPYDPTFDYNDILTYEKGSKLVGYAVITGEKKGKVTGLTITFGDYPAKPESSIVFKDYKLTITEME